MHVLVSGRSKLLCCMWLSHLGCSPVLFGALVRAVSYEPLELAGVPAVREKDWGGA